MQTVWEGGGWYHLAPQGLVFVKMISVRWKTKRYYHKYKPINLEDIKFHRFQWQPTMDSENGGVLGLLMNNLALMKNCPGGGGRGVQD